MDKKGITKSYISLAFMVLIILMPLFVLYSQVPITRSFWPWPVLLTSLGKIFGLVGLSAFAMALFLSARFVWLDKLFYGLPKAINIHRYLGIVSFSFIIFHPLFLAARMLSVSSDSAWGIFMRWSESAYLYGYVAILLFMVLIVITFFWRMKYEKLKSLHSLLAIPLMLGGVHGLLIDSDIKSIPFLAWYFIVIISISVLMYLIRLFLIDYGIKAKKFIVDELIKPTENTVKVILKPIGKGIDSKPGQFIFVNFDQIKKGEEHPFSIAEIFSDGRIAIIAKSLGDYTTKMARLAVGTKAMVDGPYGRFGAVQDSGCHQIWIAGGIGITPFIGMAKSFVEDKQVNGKVDLFYAVRSEKDLTGLDTLKQVENISDNFKLNTYISDKDGKFDMEKLKSVINNIHGCHFYICGPSGMVEYFVGALKDLKIPKRNINIEAFKFL